jgi:hypothetical protein
MPKQCLLPTFAQVNALRRGLYNRRLSLPRFEPWTCHHQRKRTLNWEDPRPVVILWALGMGGWMRL